MGFCCIFVPKFYLLAELASSKALFSLLPVYCTIFCIGELGFQKAKPIGMEAA
jgi:hypothetical protein